MCARHRGDKHEQSKGLPPPHTLGRSPAWEKVPQVIVRVNAFRCRDRSLCRAGGALTERRPLYPGKEGLRPTLKSRRCWPCGHRRAQGAAQAGGTQGRGAAAAAPRWRATGTREHAVPSAAYSGKDRPAFLLPSVSLFSPY